MYFKTAEVNTTYSIAGDMSISESCLEKAKQKKEHTKCGPSAEWGRESGDNRHGRS